MSNAVNVSAGKPKTGGAIFCAPVGTPLPTSTSEALDAAFKNLGYCSDSGLVNSTSIETTKIKAWGGETVLIINTSKEDTFKYTLIEIKNVDVLKHVYGSDNVSGTLETGITIKANNKDVPEQSVVIDMILRDNTAKRIVIPDGAITSRDEITYNDSDAVAFGITISAYPDSNASTHKEYLEGETASI